MTSPTLAQRLSRAGLAAYHAARRSWGYDAAEPSPLRRHASPLLRHEDAELTPDRRRQLLAESRDLQRNYSLAGWMLRRHLDYVATFAFQSKTGDRQLDQRIESLWTEWADEAENCDAAGRLPLADFIRLAEASRTIDGDVGIVFLADGRLQAIESDRIRTPPGGVPAEAGTWPVWSHGIATDTAGKPLAYAICRRATPNDRSPGGITWTFDRIVEARDLHLHAYFTRFDSNRGISPFASALTDLRDLADAKAYSLAKMKIGQLFGLALYRQSSDPLAPATTDDGDALAVDFSRGPYQLDLDAGDKAEILESKSPAGEFQSWFSAVTASALKALDLPFSFHSENFTNFSGARQAWIQYDNSARQKRRATLSLLNKITAWKLQSWIDAGALPPVPLRPTAWKWIPQGVPWIDPLREVQANQLALQSQLTSRRRILAEQGQDWEEILDELAAERDALAARGLSAQIGYQTPTDQPTEPDQ